MSDITAIRFSDYGGPEVLSADRIPAPQPGAGEVLVDVHAASINPIDWKVRSGMLSKVFPSAFPMITGRDGAGVISEAADDASLVGRRVCFLARAASAPGPSRSCCRRRWRLPVPDALSIDRSGGAAACRHQRLGGAGDGGADRRRDAGADPRRRRRGRRLRRADRARSRRRRRSHLLAQQHRLCARARRRNDHCL